MRTPTRALRGAALLLALSACRESQKAPARGEAAQNLRTASSGDALPETLAGFTAGALEVTPNYSRRTYSRESRAVTVTLASFPMTEEQYAGWVKLSTEAYPQAVLDVAPGTGNGFYQCEEDGGGPCALLIQLRAGAHLEIRGDARATRQDVDAVARGLPLRALAEGAHFGGRL